jgi:hypothetical protein
MSQYHDDRSAASDPGRVRLSRERLRRLEPLSAPLPAELAQRFASREQFEAMLDEHLQVGDSRAACVLSVEPLLVAAFTDELDCVAILRFPDWLAGEHNLKVGDRLLTVNTYNRVPAVVPDLIAGPKQYRRYGSFYPVIADFFSDDAARIARRKADIAEPEWDRCATMASTYLQRYPGRWRNGSPLWSWQPVTQQEVGFHPAEQARPVRPEAIAVALAEPDLPAQRGIEEAGYLEARPVIRHEDLGDDPTMRMLLPVGRSGWAIAAGYLGLFSVLCLPAPLALVAGILAIRDMRRNPKMHGMGRAVFGIVMGGIGTLILLFYLAFFAAFALSNM